MLKNIKDFGQAPVIQLLSKVGFFAIAGYLAIENHQATDTLEIDSTPSESTSEKYSNNISSLNILDTLAPISIKDIFLKECNLPYSPTTPTNDARSLNIRYPLHTHFENSSTFKPRREKGHQGTDIAAYIGTPIIAPAESEVAYNGWSSGYGNTVILYHSNNIYSLYAHLDKDSIKDLEVGHRIQEGAEFAMVGKTGNIEGVHLHTEIIIADDTGKKGQVVNPQSVWDGADLSDPIVREDLLEAARAIMAPKFEITSNVFELRIVEKGYDPSSFDGHINDAGMAYTWESASIIRPSVDPTLPKP